METLHFEGRELKPYAEPISLGELKEGSAYFAINFVDREMLTPTIETLVFIGRDASSPGQKLLCFQDATSYFAGIRRDSVEEGDDARFPCYEENEIKHVFDYERALDVLMRCALRRKSGLGTK